MDTIITDPHSDHDSQNQFGFFETKAYSGFRYVRSKNTDQSGDHNLIKDTENFSYAISCDGVSSTKSPFKSSHELVKTLDDHFKSSKSRKPRLGKITEILMKKNKEFLKKDLASTLDIFVFSNKFNYYVGLGDSSFYIFDESREIIFQNWIHNQSKIIEDHFGKKIGPEHVLVNCVGIQRPRFEMTENIKLPKNAKLIFHSDGLEEFFNNPKKICEFCENTMKFKSLDFKRFNDNQDDVSILYLQIKP